MNKYRVGSTGLAGAFCPGVASKRDPSTGSRAAYKTERREKERDFARNDGTVAGRVMVVRADADQT